MYKRQAIRLLFARIIENGNDKPFLIKESLIRMPLRLGQDVFIDGEISAINSEKFLKTFKRVFFVTKKGVVPSFLKRFQINIVPGSLESGFWSKSEGILVLSENDFFGEYSQTSRWQPVRSKASLEITTKNISHLRNGDLVVHESFGVGLYRGPIEKLFKMGVREGIELEYKDCLLYTSPSPRDY